MNNITAVKIAQGGWQVTHDGGQNTFVPTTHRFAADVQAWIDAGNTPTPEVTLAEAQAAKINELEAAFSAGNAADIQITTAAGTTATFTATPTDRGHLHDMITSFDAAGAAPSDFTWTDTSGAEVPFTLADLKTFAKALGDRGWANTKNLRSKLKAVESATTVADVSAVAW